MQRCIELGKKSLGLTYPNPNVGALIFYDGKIIGEGYTSEKGGNHAEINAINSVREKTLLKNSHLFVTMEPCVHHGKTPPCTDKIIKNQIEIIDKLLNNLSGINNLNKDEYSEEDNLFIKTLNLITTKPMLYICNVDENSVQNGNELSNKVNEYAVKNNHNSVIVSASIESQIAELEDNEEKLEMIKEMGLNSTTLTKVITSGYDLLNLINYFTCGPKETRSWTINKNTLAPQAAGKIHSDFEKGFIRAETVAYDDFIKFKGETGSRDAGKLRQEGKDYIVKNGDVMHFLFNV